jgi:N-acetylglucosaminyl-diphospho-decaprenol L-rhamnosyltransferase
MLFTISIVSHGHSDELMLILRDFNAYTGSDSLQIFLTLNAPELESLSDESLKAASVWPITIFKNKSKKGFAENHNIAFSGAASGIWCVLNPDVRIPEASFSSICNALTTQGLSLVFPTQINVIGRILDYKRELVTPWSLFKRYFFRSKPNVQHVDWVSGCFMAFPSSVYQQLKGFDEKYFLYCEDVDICLRLQLAGYKMVEADFSIIHDTRRGTLKKWDHFKWHVSSLLKLWCSRAFWAYLWNRNKIRRR